MTEIQFANSDHDRAGLLQPIRLESGFQHFGAICDKSVGTSLESRLKIAALAQAPSTARQHAREHAVAFDEAVIQRAGDV